MNIAESSKSPNLRDFSFLGSKMSLNFFIFYSSLAFFFGDSSQSSFLCIEGRDARPADGNPAIPDVILAGLRASRRNSNTLRPIANADTARINIVTGERLKPPPVARKDETRIAEIMTVGTVTAPESIEERAIFRRTTAR